MSRRGWSWRHCCTKSVCTAHQTSLCSSAPLLKRRVPVLHGANQHPEVQVIVRKFVSACLMARKEFKHVARRRKKSKILRFLSWGRNSQTQASRDCSESPPRGVCHLSKHRERERPVSIVGMTLNMFVYRVN